MFVFVAAQGMRVFMPFLVQQTTQTALSHILLAFYNCLPAAGRVTSSGAQSGKCGFPNALPLRSVRFLLSSF
jgi:hypothetical protein